MSSKPSPCWPAMPSVTSRASTIIPAQVANVASPPSIASRSGSSRPTRSISIVIVVLSPPGRTMPSSPSRSSRERTNRVRAPTASSALMCSANAPCIARTPMRGLFLPVLPASGSEQLFLGDRRDLETAHGLAQSRGDLGDDLRLVEVRRRRDDRLGTLQGVLGLEDAGADEEAVNAQLHHQRGVGRGGDAAGGEVDDGKAAELLALRQHV